MTLGWCSRLFTLFFTRKEIEKITKSQVIASHSLLDFFLLLPVSINQVRHDGGSYCDGSKSIKSAASAGFSSGRIPAHVPASSGSRSPIPQALPIVLPSQPPR